jgi:hypothetical protein
MPEMLVPFVIGFFVSLGVFTLSIWLGGGSVFMFVVTNIAKYTGFLAGWVKKIDHTNTYVGSLVTTAVGFVMMFVAFVSFIGVLCNGTGVVISLIVWAVRYFFG